MSAPERTLRVGMVGHGFMGKTHTHAYRSLAYYCEPPPAKIELAGVATRTEASWQRAVARWGYEFGTTDAVELCRRDDIDIIDCATPNAAHKEILLAALAHGKHVYMDKPLATTLDDAREMARVAAAHPECITQMAFQYRFVPALMRAKELLDAGALGRIFSARVAYLHAGYIDPKRPFSWRLDVAQSGRGGALFDLGAHVVDLTRHLLGDLAEVFHVSETFIPERPAADDPTRLVPVEVDDLSILLFRLVSGGVGSIESSRIATGVQDEVRFEAHGSRGGIRFNLMQPNYLEFYDATAAAAAHGGDRGFKAIESVARYGPPFNLPGPKNTIGWERFHIYSIFNFVRQVVAGRPADPDILAGAKTQAILAAALQSSDRDRWVAVPSVDISPQQEV